MITPADSSRSLYELAASRLRPQGWEVDHDAESGYFHIRVGHPLTSRSALAFPNDGGDHSAFFETQLARREFRVIAERPEEMPNESLVGKIRVAAQANNWSADVVSVIARTLVGENVLTEEEAEWLETAGPAWHELD